MDKEMGNPNSVFVSASLIREFVMNKNKALRLVKSKEIKYDQKLCPRAGYQNVR